MCGLQYVKFFYFPYKDKLHLKWHIQQLIFLGLLLDSREANCVSLHNYYRYYHRVFHINCQQSTYYEHCLLNQFTYILTNKIKTTFKYILYV